jgi:propionyl-CoA carboxylase alpha chain
MHEAARRAAEAIGYWGAGTVEFLLDEGGDRFFFLEMNTRLQVEHPVTEEVFGVDLVEMQLDVAEGHGFSDLVLSEIERREEPRSEDDDPNQPRGHAIEVRLYAEDPAADYQPQSGLLTCLEIPVEEGIRVESGFETGCSVSTHYDAMIAKVVAHAATRQHAARKLASVLARARIHGLVTNRDLLVGILRDRGFLGGDLSTAYLAERELGPATADLDGAATAAALAIAAAAAERRRVQGGVPAGWRNVAGQPQWVELAAGGTTRRVGWRGTRDGFVVDVGEGADGGGCEVVAVTPQRVTLQADGLRTTYAVALTGLPGHEVADVDWPGGHVRFERTPRFVDPADQVAVGSLLAPMPGTVIGISATVGEHVTAGQPVLALEAMKMQHTVSAPHDGVVVDLPVSLGDQVAANAVLAVVQEEPEAPAAEGDSND